MCFMKRAASNPRLLFDRSACRVIGRPGALPVRFATFSGYIEAHGPGLGHTALSTLPGHWAEHILFKTSVKEAHMAQRPNRTRTYFRPHRRHRHKPQLLNDRAVFTEGLCRYPQGGMRDIVTSHLPF